MTEPHLSCCHYELFTVNGAIIIEPHSSVFLFSVRKSNEEGERERKSSEEGEDAREMKRERSKMKP